MQIILDSLEQGLLYCLITLGLYVSFRVIDFPDLTVDGSFTLGAAIIAVGITSGYNPILFSLLAALTGYIAGTLTGLLHMKLGIDKIVSGIVMTVILYSVNLRIMGQSNISLLNHPTIIDYFSFMSFPNTSSSFLIFTILALFVKTILDWFFSTQIGTIMRAIGRSEQFVSSLAVSAAKIKVIGLGIANALIAVAGALSAQYQGFSDVNMGFGIITIGFASLVIGEKLLGEKHHSRLTLGAIIGTTIYFLILSVAMRLGVTPGDLKMVTGGMIVTVLYMTRKPEQL